MAANLDDVAQIAGVAKGTLYRYFESKADLYVAVLSHNGRVFQDRMRESAAGPGARLRGRLRGRRRRPADRRCVRRYRRC